MSNSAFVNDYIIPKLLNRRNKVIYCIVTVSYSIVAFSVVKLTCAFTLSILFNRFSIRFEQATSHTSNVQCGFCLLLIKTPPLQFIHNIPPLGYSSQCLCLTFSDKSRTEIFVEFIVLLLRICKIVSLYYLCPRLLLYL